MRHAWLAVLLLLPILSGTADARPEPSPVLVREARITDPKGDVKVTGPTGSQADDGRNAHVDIRSVWISNETLTHVEFGIRFERSEDSSPAGGLNPAGRAFAIRFDLGGSRLAVFQRAYANCGGGDTIGLMRSVGTGYSVYCGLPHKLDKSAGSVQVMVRREILLNETGFPFGPGVPLTNFTADASQATSPHPSVPAGAHDRAPDSGVGPEYRSTLGNVTGSGGLELFSREPVRVSNGESTTLVYPVELINHRNVESTILLSAETNETTWSLRTPARLVLPANGIVKFPVILSMGFTHRHGEISTFIVRAQDASDPDRWSQMGLGVYWLETPQPAGHHDKIWLHSGGMSTSSGGTYECRTVGQWMNPLEDEGRGAGADPEVPACPFEDLRTGTSFPQRQVFEWTFRLAPELAIGLDFDLSRSAHFTTQLKTKLSTNRAVLDAELLYCDPDAPRKRTLSQASCPGDFVTLARGASAPKAMAAASPTGFDLDLGVEPVADLLQYEKKSNLVLLLRLTVDGAQTPPNRGSPEASPLLLPKTALLTLPLIEYHDPIDQAFENVGSLRLRALGPFEKPVNPGRTTFFAFDLANVGAGPQSVRIETEGPNRDWARFLESPELRLEAQENRTIRLRIDVPDDAAPGVRAELFVVVQSLDDPNVVAISRLRAAVVDPAVQDVPDETDPSGDDRQDTPGLGLAAVLAVLSIALLVRRRH